MFADRDGDCLVDPGEPMIAGVRVDLFDDSGTRVASTTTDADGNYVFSFLPAGRYTVRETQPAGYLHGGQMAGSHGGDDTADDVIAAIDVDFGDRLVDYNFCELEPSSITGVVYVDANRDCIRDPDERPLSGVTITLRDGSGAIVGTTTTDGRGRYAFDGLAPGDYTVTETQPDGFFQGGQVAGTGDGRVVGEDVLGVTLGPNEDVTDYDFCELPPASIAGTVYADADGDCEQDPDEIGLGGVTITLRDAAGTVVATTTTDADGNYAFDDLAPGEYTITETQPEGYFQGGQVPGTGEGWVIGRDILGVRLLGGESLVDYDFCETPPASLAGYVYVDTDGDCDRDPDERPIADVPITLRDTAGNVVAITTTDAAGRYEFTGLAPGEYSVTETQPEGYYQGGQTPGTGDGWVIGDDVLGVRLSGGEDVTDYDFCELPPASIAGTVYVDADGDCVYDPEESPLVGVTITLRDASGATVGTTTTDADGNYSFDDLAPGEYSVTETQPDGYYQGDQVPGTGDGWVIDADRLGFRVNGGENLTDYDFCELPPASLSGRVWSDQTVNGVFDPDESPIPGVLIELVDEAGGVTSTRTAADGTYAFTGLAPGVYTVRETQPAGYFDSRDLVGTAGGTNETNDIIVGIALPGGFDATGYDFAEIPPATISGYVFADGDAIRTASLDPADLRDFKDGRRTTDDTPLEGVRISLRNVLGQPVTGDRALPGVYGEGPIEVVTDADGYYEFTGLRSAAYHVYEVQPEGYADALDTPGTTGGEPINPADAIDDDTKIVIQTLSSDPLTDPGQDALLFVFPGVGQRSEENNFSEVTVVDPPPQIDVLPTPDEPVVAPLPPVPDPRPQRIVTFAAPVRPVVPTQYNDEYAVSWHLSIINAGRVGGADVAGVDPDSPFRTAAFGRQDDDAPNVIPAGHDVGRWTLRTIDGRTIDTSDLTLGETDAVAMTGDFNGDGLSEAVIYVAGRWYVDVNGNGIWDSGDLWIRMGTEMDAPVVGDWDGDGKDDVGIFGRMWEQDPARIKHDPGLPDPANRRRRNIDATARGVEDRGEADRRERLMKRGDDGDLRAAAVDHVFAYGEPTDAPVAGDWNGDGVDQIGTFSGGRWRLDSDGDGRLTRADTRGTFGRPGDTPIVLDVDGDGVDEIGVARGDQFIIDTDGDRRLTGNDLRITVPRPTDASPDDIQPVTGDFDGDGKDDIGYYRRAG